MALLEVLAGILRVLGQVARGVLVGAVAVVRGLGKGIGLARTRGGAGEAGMIRLLDLHAASIAGDTLIAIGLAGTIFFAVPAGEARGRVALYLLVTMLPFALLAPVVGPVLDRFRHGRRYALAVTFLGRAFLAYLISENLDDIALYPAAFGVLVLSRAYGVARSAAVPRLLPPKLALSAANARASLFGTIAGAVVAPIGILATTRLGQPWPLRIATLVFLYGMVTALRLPPKADSEPPEAMPRALQRQGAQGGQGPLARRSSWPRSSAPPSCARSTASWPSTWPSRSARARLELDFLGTPVKRDRRDRAARRRAGRRHVPVHRRRLGAAHPPAGAAAGGRHRAGDGGGGAGHRLVHACPGSRCCAWSRRWPAAWPSSRSTRSSRNAPATAPGPARSRTPRRC